MTETVTATDTDIDGHDDTRTRTRTRNQEDAVRQVVADRTAAYRAGDAERFCSHYAEDVVVFNLAPPLVQPSSSDRGVAGMTAWFEGKGGGVWVEVRDLEVTVSGDLAMCTSLQSMGARPESPQPFTLWYRATLGLRRVDATWLVVHEHTSTPFYMDGSLRAATDLEP